VCNHGLIVKSFACARGKRLERRQITKWIGAIRGLHGDECTKLNPSLSLKEAWRITEGLCSRSYSKTLLMCASFSATRPAFTSYHNDLFHFVSS
jgi:hypothetical protein